MSETALSLPGRLDDRLNPILVKEVRQALRGRFFRWMFGFTLLVTTFVGLLVVAISAANTSSNTGREFFLAIYACMGAAVVIFVPFSAYLSTSAEWDENTHDLLVLSNLGPGQIVSGKLFSALIQALLYYSTFTPFLVAAFLLNGLDLLVAGVVIACSMVTCLALSLAGIALAGLARQRALRGVLMALFGAGLTIAWGLSIGMVGGLAFDPQELRSDEGQIAVGVYLMVALLVGGIAAVIAMARFSHEEENRSTPLRVLSWIVPLLASGWALWMHTVHADHELSFVLQLVAAHPLLLMWIFFMTEPEGLGRRTTKFVLERPRLAAFLLPLLPGGGRGVLLFLAHALFALGSVVALNLLWGTPRTQAFESFGVVWWFYAYCFAYLGVPTGLASRLWKSDTARVLLRVALVVAWPLLLFVPVVVGLILGIRGWEEFEHPLNPYWIAMQIDKSGSVPELWPAFIVVAMLDVLALFLNAPRLLRGIREPLAARARRTSAPAPANRA